MIEQTDPRWVRDGRSMREWLLLLVSSDRAARRQAENAISAMFWGAPVADATVYQHSPKDVLGHRRDFARAIADTLASAGFDGEPFVRAALVQMRRARVESRRATKLEDAFFDSDADDDQDRAFEQLKARKAEHHAGKLANSFGDRTLHQVIEHAGAVLMRVPDVVRKAIRHEATADTFAKAVESLGPSAVVFAPDLIAQLDSSLADERARKWFRYPSALAAVGRENAATVAALEHRLLSPNGAIRGGAAQTLERMGDAAARRSPTLVETLKRLSAPPRYELLASLASVGRNRRDVLEIVLEAARPAPPRMISPPQFPRYQNDETMHVRGTALEALAYFPSFPERAVPVLVDALATFEEYDPDWGYERGNHGRVVHSLSRFAPDAAAAAVPALVERLRGPDGETDWRIVKYLGEIGPPARGALDALIALRAGLNDVRDVPDPTGEGIDPVMDPLRWAIWRVQEVGAIT